MPSAVEALLFLAALGPTACAEVPTVSPSELNAHADQYDGKTVHVRGWLVLQFEDVGLWDSKDAHDRPHNGGDRAALLQMQGASLIWPATCVSVTGEFLHELRRFQSEPATVEGVFRKHIFPPDVVSNQVCNDSGLEIAKITKQNG